MVVVVIKVTKTFLSRLIQGTTMVLDSYNVSTISDYIFINFIFKKLKMHIKIQIKHFGNWKRAVKIEWVLGTWDKPLIFLASSSIAKFWWLICSCIGKKKSGACKVIWYFSLRILIATARNQVVMQPYVYRLQAEAKKNNCLKV